MLTSTANTSIAAVSFSPDTNAIMNIGKVADYLKVTERSIYRAQKRTRF